ncbi:MAG: CvpA family protein [Bacteroidota bacterium]
MNINIIDIIVLIPFLWGAFKGFKNGFISEGGTVAALILGIWAAVRFSEQGGAIIQEYFSVSVQYKEIIAFASIFLIVVIISFFITKLLHNLFKAISLEWLNKLLGVVFGAGKYLIILAFLFFLIETMTIKYYAEPIAVLDESLFFKPMAEFAEMLLEGNITLPDIHIPSSNEMYSQ